MVPVIVTCYIFGYGTSISIIELKEDFCRAQYVSKLREIGVCSTLVLGKKADIFVNVHPTDNDFLREGQQLLHKNVGKD